MKKFISAFLVAILVPASALAAGFGHIGSANVNTELRTKLYCLPKLDLGASTDVTVGLKQVVFRSASMSGVTSFTTGTIGALPYPSKLRVRYWDGSADYGTMVCTSVSVLGKNQFGDQVTDTMSISESFTATASANITTNVYESITSITGSGCTAGTGANDVIVASVHLDGVGLPLIVKGDAAVLAINWDDGGTGRFQLPGASDAVTTFDNAGSGNRMDSVRGAINLTTTLDGTNSVADGDGICLRLRAPNGR